MLRSWFLFHVASGQAFFSGAALIVAAIALSPRSRGWLRPLRNLGLMFGVCWWPSRRPHCRGGPMGDWLR